MAASAGRSAAATPILPVAERWVVSTAASVSLPQCNKEKASDEDDADYVDEEDAESDGDESPADLGHAGSPINGFGEDDDLETLDRHTVRDVYNGVKTY